MNLNIKRIISLLVALCLTLLLLCGCGEKEQPQQGTSDGHQTEAVDYVSQLKLDMTSETLKAEVTVKSYIDGDTTHFNIDPKLIEGGILKARYLAVNTPESTGKIEEWGKKASNFTKNALMNAESIYVESDTSKWDIDSTGSRYLVWVWYKPQGETEYRNLNLELLQNGLAIASSSANNRYGDICVKAIAQAKEHGLCVHSKEKDPDFYYGEAVELTLKELRTNIEQYNGMTVAFNGVVITNSSNSVYVEDYDAESDMYYGMYVYYGYSLPGAGLEILSVGNLSRIVGTVQYYETGGTWQVSGLSYRMMKPDDPSNIQKISDSHQPGYQLVTADRFVNGTVEAVTAEEELKTFKFAEMAMGTSIEMHNLKVVSTYTTDDEESSSYGAISLYCESDGVKVTVRTAVLYDADGNRITADAYEGKTLDVKGIVDYFGGEYQIKVYSANNITVY